MPGLRGKDHWHHNDGDDHLPPGTEVVTDSGYPVWSGDYTAYGELLSSYGNAPAFGYAGMMRDALSGHYFTHYRVYNPKAGRWVSADPIGFAGGRNLYGYVGGNPVSFTDPKGLAFVEGAPGWCQFCHPPPPPVFPGNQDNNGGPMPAPDPTESRASEKERAADVPSWSKGYAQKPGENCDEFAERILNQQYGCDDPRAQKRGAGSEHSMIKKNCERRWR